jgi:CBS domain-containing protein
MFVKEIMTKKVVTIHEDDSVYTGCLKYQDQRVGCLLVKDKNDCCVGIVTERDFIERTICAKKDPMITKIKEIMSSNLHTIHPLAQYKEALEIMKEFSLKKLPVIRDNYLVGIITSTDIAHAHPDLSDEFMKTWVKPRW